MLDAHVSLAANRRLLVKPTDLPAADAAAAADPAPAAEAADAAEPALPPIKQPQNRVCHSVHMVFERMVMHSLDKENMSGRHELIHDAASIICMSNQVELESARA